ncbi:MAG: bifunctional molybdenum cofactor biosynthesis protein MoaC/MoaB [Fimbriimonadaceae bacterium]
MADEPKHPPGMRDITHKVASLRIATAKATVSMKPETVLAVRENLAPKGDPIAVARVAATIAAKHTPQFIPYCHPIPVDHVVVEFELRDSEIDCIVSVKTVYKTGVEVEAMAAASIGALNIYDLLKPIDDGIAIESVRLVSKVGGKTDWQSDDAFSFTVITVSDRCSKGEQADISGITLVEGVETFGGILATRSVVPDEADQIQARVSEHIQKHAPNLIMLTGGTGVGPRDKTFEALCNRFDLRLPGVEEHFRRYSQERVPTAMLSRCVAGVIGGTVVIAVPGSPKACKDAINCLFPAITHTFSMLKGKAHE